MPEPPDKPEPRRWSSRLAQITFGVALVKAGLKHSDPEMVQQGLAHQKKARSPPE